MLYHLVCSGSKKRYSKKSAILRKPAGVKADIAADTLVFHVVRPQEEVEPEPAAEEAATEPEAINEKKTEARAAEKESKEKEHK